MLPLYLPLPPRSKLSTLPQAGRLQYFQASWHTLTTDPWVLETVAGYRLDLLSPPTQPSEPHPHRLDASLTQKLDEEVCEMVAKGAITQIPEREKGFLSPFFAVPKADSIKIRPIIDLRALNDCLQYHHFKMESLKTVADLLQPGDVMIKIDLRDAYFSIPVARSSRRFLQFRWHHRLYRFNCLPFGLSSAPRVFTKTLHPLVTMARSLGVRLVIYLDDLLIMAQTTSDLFRHVATILHLLIGLGFDINWKKSHLIPTRQIQYLGIQVNSVTMEFSLPDTKAAKLQQHCAQLLTAHTVSLRDIASIVGLLVSTMVAVAPAPLHYRRLLCLKNTFLRQGRPYTYQLALSPECRAELQWWIRHLQLWNGRPVRISEPDLVIQSDASSTGRSGWGACCGNVTTGGRWTSAEKQLHINALELFAAQYAVQSLAPSLYRGSILLQLDNSVAVACLLRKGSNASPTLDRIAATLWEWCLLRDITLIPQYLPGAVNTVADYHSRHHTDASDWMLNRSVFQDLQIMWPSTCDLFASRMNSQLPTYVSWRPDPYAHRLNAFSLDWSCLQAYAFPPICLIGKCLARIVLQEVPSIVMVTPLWPGQAWFPALLALVVDVTRVLPASPVLLTGPDHEVHPLVQSGHLTLVAWKLSGLATAAAEFRATLPTYSWRHGVPAPNVCISRHGTNGVIGVAHGKSIPWMLLSQRSLTF
ncbi:uncharacterized protein LOC135816808 [Sycon ciliatum]|uniref:uncharacterized protein LOC135816808 n=1 Tax=Sycon ciliatum TaxID=27933 RepID=UPI0031F6F446